MSRSVADALRLRSALIATITAMPLGLAPACSGPQTEVDPPETTQTTVSTEEAVAPPFAVHSDEVCATSGEWAMTVGAARHRAEEAGLAVPLASATGCPDNLQTIAPQHAAMRRAAGRTLQLWIDEWRTQEARESGAVDLCVYSFNDLCEEEYHYPVVGRLLAADADDRTGVTAGVTSARQSPWFDDVLAAALDALPLPSSPLDRQRIAAGWLRDAGYEHASVASFHRAALELVMHGAPPALLDGCAAAAADEVAHARSCYTLAGHYVGERLAPEGFMPPAPRHRTLAELAADTLREGAIGETVAILSATRQLRHCTIAPVRAVLQTILDDETRHAALAWATVGWALREEAAGRATGVRRAVLETLAEAEAAVGDTPDAPSALPGDVLAEHGRLPGEASAAVHRDAIATIVRPLLDALLAETAA